MAHHSDSSATRASASAAANASISATDAPCESIADSSRRLPEAGVGSSSLPNFSTEITLVLCKSWGLVILAHLPYDDYSPGRGAVMAVIDLAFPDHWPSPVELTDCPA